MHSHIQASTTNVHKFFFRTYLKEAEQDDVKAFFHLALSYQMGTGTEINLTQAAYWFKLAADRGHVQAQNSLGRCYKYGLGVVKDEMKAFQYYKMAADQGDVSAQLHVGWYYQSGFGVEKNAVQAFEYYKKAADKGNARAQSSLGWCYRHGCGTDKDVANAFVYYQKAADQGHARALFNLGQCYEIGLGTKISTKSAFNCYQKAADQGHARAQLTLGICYRDGLGTNKDAGKYFEYIKQAADQDYAVAQCELGSYYEEKNEEKSFEYYQKAADRGYILALFNLGRCYEIGLGTEKDKELAFQCFQKSADQGLARAQYQLGLCYQAGFGTSKNEAEALRCFQKAADKNHVRSQHWLNKKIAFDPDFILEEAAKSKHCYIPKKFPNLVDQQGPYCGSAAFAEGCNYAQLLSHPLYASTYEKKESGKNLDDGNADVVLEQLNRTRFPSEGPQYSIYSFQDLAQHYKLNDCTAFIFPENCTEEKYRNIICEAFRKGYVLILPSDNVNEMPRLDKGESTHWTLGFGYWCDKQNDYKIAVVHHGLYCEWSIHDLYESNQHLPKKNPNQVDGSLAEFRFSLFKMKVQYPREVIDLKPSIKY